MPTSGNKLRALPHREQIAYLLRHGKLGGFGVVAKGVEDLIELFGRSQGEIEKENFPPSQDAAAAAVAGQPFLADFIAQPPCQIETMPQEVLPYASLLLQFSSGRTDFQSVSTGWKPVLLVRAGIITASALVADRNSTIAPSRTLSSFPALS